MAYDIARQRVVLFGGRNSQLLGDTWEWDGAVWRQFAVAGPLARAGHSMAYDAARAATVVFGGQVPSPVPDVWEWNGTSWRSRPAAVGLPARTGAGMAYDIARDRLVVHGGETLTTTAQPIPHVLGDTWEWDGVRWTECRPRHSPGPISNGALVYDFIHGRTLLLGPYAWSWDGNDWTAVNPQVWPRWRLHLAAAYDVQRDRTVLFGGSQAPGSGSNWQPCGDTWELGPLGVALGPGCPGSNAVLPRLDIATPPRLGGGYRAELDGLPATATVAVVIAGSSDTTSPFGPLPIDLAPIGMPGCMLRVSPDQFAVVAVQGARGDYTVVVPDAPALVGLSMSNQAACPDPGANALGVTLSNAVRVTVEW